MLGFFIAVVLLEIAGVYVGHEWWLHRFRHDLVPVDVTEPRVLHDLRDALVAVVRVLL